MYSESRLTPEHRTELVAFIARERPTVNGMIQWFARHGHHVGKSAAANCRAHLGPQDKPPSRTLKVDLLLTHDDRNAYLTLIHDPRTNIVKAARWLKEHGYNVGGHAVRHHFHEYAQCADKMFLTVQTAADIRRICKAEGPAIISEGMLTYFEQLMMERLKKANEDKPFTTAELYELSRTISNTVQSRHRLGEEQRTSGREQRKLDRAAQRTTKKTGATPRDVAIRVREMLGLRIPPKPEPRRRRLPDASASSPGTPDFGELSRTGEGEGQRASS